MSNTTLVTGDTGKLGRRLVRKLEQKVGTCGCSPDTTATPGTLCATGPDAQHRLNEVADRIAHLAWAEPSGMVADIGGPEVTTGTELAKQYLSAIGSKRVVVPLWLPGKIFAAFSRGYHLTPDNRYGVQTFESFHSEFPSRRVTDAP